MTTIKLNLNRRSDFIIQKVGTFDASRLLSIALPFASLNATTSKVASIGALGYQCYTIFQQKDDSSSPDKTIGKWPQLALLASSVAFGIFCPTGQLVFSSGAFFLTHTIQLKSQLQQREWKQSGKTVLQIAHQAIHLASVYYGTPAYLALSLISQACVEMSQAFQFSQEKGKTLEMFASLSLSLLRLHKASSYLPQLIPMKTGGKIKAISSLENLEKIGSGIERVDCSGVDDSLKENPPESLKKLTDKDWNNLIYQTLPGELKDLRSFLLKKGFSTEIENVIFFGLPQGVLLQQLKFKQCSFSGVDFSHALLDQVIAEDCFFAHTNWSRAFIKNCTFHHCSFQYANFFKLSLESTIFTNNCDFIRTLFNEARLKRVTIQDGILMESNFLLATVENSKLIDCNLTDVLLLDAKNNFTIRGGTPHQITRPVIALGWDFDEPGHYTCLIRKALQHNGALVLQYNQTSVSLLSEVTLEREITIGLQKAKSPEKSISVQLLQNAGSSSEIAEIKRIAFSILKHADGLVLPGGDNIEKCFYNPSKPPKYSHRTLLEIALLYEAQKKHLPTLGVCRGAQLINVFCGGTLVDCEKTQHGTDLLEWTSSPHGKELQSIVGNLFRGKSAHEQASDKIGQGLHVILKLDNIPKFLVSEDGNLMASQVHPEDYYSKSERLREKMKISDEEAFNQFLATDLSKEVSTLEALLLKLDDTIAQDCGGVIFDLWVKGRKKALKHVSKSENTRQFIVSNRKVYQFFLDKVEKRRKNSSIENVPTTLAAG